MVCDRETCANLLDKNYKFKVFIFFLTVSMDALDLLSDWLFYRDVYLAEDGLVFSAFSETLIKVMLSFCCIGTILFLAELFLMCFDIIHKSCDLPVAVLDIATFLSVWIEDVPQIIIHIRIAACHEEAISVFQLTKACATIGEAFVKLLMMSGKLCFQRCTTDETTTPTRCVKTSTYVKCLTIPGLVTMVIGSVLVFGFTQFKYDTNDDTLVFHNPTNYLKGEFKDMQKYFREVGVYININTTEGVPATMNSDDWIKLLDINKIGTVNSAVVTRIQYTLENNGYLMVYKNSERNYKYGPSSNTSQCYKMHENNMLLKNLSECTNVFANMLTKTILIKFVLIHPRDYLPFGDIHYNGAVYSNDSCTQMAKSKTVFSLRYFKPKPSFENGGHLFPTKNLVGHFYNVYDLQDIHDVWKTGFLECESNVRKHPLFQASVTLPCDP